MTNHKGEVIATHTITANEIPQTLTVIDCVACGWKHLDPLVPTETLKRFYGPSDAFYGEASGHWFATQTAHHALGLWDAYYRFKAELLGCAGMVPGWAANIENSMLDWGAGAGYFVEFWNKNMGWAVGIDPSEKARNSGGNFVIPAPHDRMFDDDIPAMHHCALTLEHLSDPVQFLRDTQEYNWGKGSRLLITVPNDFNPIHKRLMKRGRKPWWVAKDHMNYFDPAGLRACVEAAGLRVVWEGATAPHELLLLLGYNYVGDDAKGLKQHMVRLGIEKKIGWRIYYFYQWLYKRFGIGRELIFLVEAE